MRTIIAAICIVFLFLAATAAKSAEPERSNGISAQMLPKRVAELGQKKWGFVVAYAQFLKPEQLQPVLQSPTEVLAFIRKQDASVQENGLWIVISHPDAYSEEEKNLLEAVKTLSRREKFPLFVVRGSQLPNGWQRYESAP